MPQDPTIPGRPPGSPRRRALEALLGTTRTAILRRIATRPRATTTDLADDLGVSPPTVSHHTAVLRNCGLISTRRCGASVHHDLTPLGRILLAG